MCICEDGNWNGYVNVGTMKIRASVCPKCGRRLIWNMPAENFMVADSFNNFKRREDNGSENN